jgi:uncharacterized protein YodC (DUF2158 family)
MYRRNAKKDAPNASQHNEQSAVSAEMYRCDWYNGKDKDEAFPPNKRIG